MSSRRERDYRLKGEKPRCQPCFRADRFGPKPTTIHVTEELRRWWLDRYTLDEIGTLAAGLDGN